jgi:hypothetical protein
MYLKLSSWGVWVRTEKNAKVGHIIDTRDVDIFDDPEFPVISHGQSFSALNQPVNDICSDVADVFMPCQLVRQSTAAAADSFELTTNCPSQGFAS